MFIGHLELTCVKVKETFKELLLVIRSLGNIKERERDRDRDSCLVSSQNSKVKIEEHDTASDCEEFLFFFLEEDVSLMPSSLNENRFLKDMRGEEIRNIYIFQSNL